jgi:hypothetical protein
MAKKATTKAGGADRSKGTKKSASKSPARAVARRSGGANGGGGAQDSMGEAFIKLLQSPLVADLVAVAATAALASLAEEGFNRSGASGGKRAGRAVKLAGKAAAAAIGRRLGTEIDEIRKAAKQSKGGAAA